MPITSTKNDSVQIERVVEYHEPVRIDTVLVPVPAQTAEKTTPEKSSHLETDFAASDARINSDGTMHHKLWNKPQNMPVIDRENKEANIR